MNVKAIDIARALGISKSTVSLALNGKPGVKEKTRQEVMLCKQRLEQNQQLPAGCSESRPEAKTDRQIKVVRIDNGMKNIQGTELNLWTDVQQVFEKNLRAHGYSLGLMFADMREKDQSEMIAECNADGVVGVIMFGTELKPENMPVIERIKKPMVVYDTTVDSGKYPFVVVDNRQGVELAVNELFSKGNTDIRYLGNPMPMYNYLSRRRGFLESMGKRGIEDAGERIIDTGSSVDEVTRFMKSYLQSTKLPHAFIMESYHVSMGTIIAMQSLGLKSPEDVSLIGIDTLPKFLTGGWDMTSIRIPHTERAYWTVQLLLKELEHPVREKSKLYTNCLLVNGETVLKRL